MNPSCRILLLFGGDHSDQALATDYAAMGRKFRSDSKTAVTAISTIHLDDVDALDKGPLVLCEGGTHGPWYVVWERGDDPFFEVHPEGTMKRPVLDWLDANVTNARAGEKITLVICCYGRDEEVFFGMRDNLNETFTATELLRYLNSMPRGTAFNLINLACSSGTWVVKLRDNTFTPGSDLRITAHAASAPGQIAWQFRSASGEDRCGVFSPAVIKSFRQGGTMFTHHRRVENRCKQYRYTSQAMLEVFSSSIRAEQTRTVYTATTWAPLPQLTGIWSTITSAASAVIDYFSPGRRAPGYGVVKAAVEKMTAVSYRENGLYVLGRRYLQGELRTVEKRVLEEVMTQRRASQLQVFFFLQEAIARGLFSADLFEVPVDSADYSPSNFKLLNKCFPNVRDGMKTITEPQLVISFFDAPLEWLALCLAAGTQFHHHHADDGPSPTTRELLAVGESIGWECAEVSVVADLALHPLEEATKGFATSKSARKTKVSSRPPLIFDFVLPTRKPEWEDFEKKWTDYQGALLL